MQGWGCSAAWWPQLRSSSSCQAGLRRARAACKYRTAAPFAWGCTTSPWPSAAVTTCEHASLQGVTHQGGDPPPRVYSWPGGSQALQLSPHSPKAGGRGPGAWVLGPPAVLALWICSYTLAPTSACQPCSDTQRAAGKTFVLVALDSFLWRLGWAVVNQCHVAFTVNSRKIKKVIVHL